MHELALAQAVVAIACEHAGGGRVEKVELRVGALRQVVPDPLRFAFELLAQGTAAEGAELALELVPARVACRACGVETEVGAFPLACWACRGLDVDVVAGEEFEVEALEVVGAGVGEERSAPWT